MYELFLSETLWFVFGVVIVMHFGVEPSQFFGEKIVCGLIGVSAFPLMNALGIHPFGPWPLWAAAGTRLTRTFLAAGLLVASLAGIAMPIFLFGRLPYAIAIVAAGLPTVADLCARSRRLQELHAVPLDFVI